MSAAECVPRAGGESPGREGQARYRFLPRTHCPACGSADTVPRYGVGFDEAPIRAFIENYYRIDAAAFGAARYQLDRCRSCTLLFQRWIGDETLLRELYGVWIEKEGDPEVEPSYREDIRDIPRSRDAHEIMVAAAHLRLTPRDMTTLDYGMGWALWARIAAWLGCRSYGFDLSPSRMDFAALHGVVTLEDDEIGPPRFHFINTEQVFEHVPEPGRLAEKLAGALLPGGILKISVPAGDGADAIIARLEKSESGLSRDDLMPVQPLEHVNCFTRRSVDLLAARLGFNIVTPSLVHRYAFLRRRGTVPLLRPKKLAKELIRPFYQFHNRRNLYRWLQKPTV